ncbi:MAG: hypothetical protein A3C06_00905 [Candidatus Taylorbacteria bacterium RIFCSPHIGHO2_02_FULL_46_13]|uniref:Phosphoglycerate mutase n=2 Tax=Parcubacteria group TaxID=1794811 RepID=A0A1G2HVQ7_9BACT|nr:MAG: hypothetical protein A2822_01345 [Candidatus Staskawiczbacteria bacterium RIFCSPHIGHO2_01_FULL_41_41]OHA27262.1 MAG: hypothetical protein A3C06_00905 [Candidatus Taylorbacteria bacterium RIFCSPHIGHO2_02_FULL_46_13]
MRLYIDVMRHAHATKVPGVDDLYRPLSEMGISQALAARDRYRNEFEKIRLVLHSPAPRALCTAAIIIGEVRQPFINVDRLWTFRNQRFGNQQWQAFDKYGYELPKYLEDPVAAEAMHYFGSHAAIEVLNQMDLMLGLGDYDGDIVIVAGHAVCSNFLAFHLSGKQDDNVFKIALAETRRLRLVFEDGKYVGIAKDDH